MERIKILRKLLLIVLSFPFFVANAQNDVDEIIRIIKNRKEYPNYNLVAAHRGYWANYPENSTAAYNAAVDIGADIVEMDVRLTSDSEMVVFHDACLNRVTNGSGLLSTLPWSYVQSLRLKMTDGTTTGYRVLSLTDALDLLKGRAVVSIDIKEGGSAFEETMIRALKMVKEKNMLNQTIVKGRLTLDDLKTKVLAPANIELKDFIYTPVAFSNTANLERYLTDFLNTKQIYGIELVYKQSTNEPILQYIPNLKNQGVWVGQYSFWPETSYGVFAEKNPLTDCDVVLRNYNFLDNV